MAQDIVPIELGLPQGDVVTLWAPRWREEGEEWEAFLGHEEALYAFADPARLTAFVRTAKEHDLDDHPAWHVVASLSAIDLSPNEDHQFDLVGVPELVSEPPDTWTINELADIVSIARSLAEVCELDKVDEIFDTADGFAMLDQGTLAFSGRDGQRRWKALCAVVAERWDELLDAIDGVITEPAVPDDALSTAETELAEAWDSSDDSARGESDESDESGQSDEDASEDEHTEDEQSLQTGFWGEIGIDPIRIITSNGDYYSLRCYLDDEPIFFGTGGRIEVFKSARALTRFLAEEASSDFNDLEQVATWPRVTEKANSGDLEIGEIDPDNTYVLNGLDQDLADGPSAVDVNQLDLAEELLIDAATWSEDKETLDALRQSESLGWLVSFVLRPNPNRLPPSPPFDAEVGAWRGLVEKFEGRLNVN